MLLQFHHILILAITAKGMFLPHHGDDDPRASLSFTALLNGEKADHPTWKPGESFTTQTDQEPKKPSPTEEFLTGGDIVNSKTPHTAGDNTPQTSATRTTISTNHDYSQSEKDLDASWAEASSSRGTSSGDYAALSEDRNGENHGKYRKDANLGYLQEPWSHEHELRGDEVTRAESTLLDIDLLKDSDPNSLLASWSGWDRSPEHDPGHVRESAGQDEIDHRPSASPSQTQESPKKMYAHVSPIQTPSPQHETLEVSILGHKRPHMDGDSGEDVHEAKQLKTFDFGSFPFDLTNSPNYGILPSGTTGVQDLSNRGHDKHLTATMFEPSTLGDIGFRHNHQEGSLYGDHDCALIDQQPWQYSTGPFHLVTGKSTTEGSQNGLWKIPIGPFGPDVDPSMEALLRATVLPSIMVPSKSVDSVSEETIHKPIHEGRMQHFTPQNHRERSSNRYSGIPKYPKSLNPSGTGTESTLLPHKEILAVSRSESPIGNKRPLDPSILKESFSKYLIYLLHQIPNMGFDLNSVKDCILPHSIMVIKSDLNTRHKRKTLIILSQVTMYLLHLSPRNNLPGLKRDIKSAVYDDVLQWVNRILLHPDVDQSEIPLMTGCEMRQRKISPVLQSLLSHYLKDTSNSFETVKQKELEYTHMLGAVLVDEWLIGYYTELWRKLITVTRDDFNPENTVYKGLLKTSVQPEIDQKIPLDQMKTKLGLTIYLCEMIGEDSISKEIESLTNLLITMNLSPRLLQNKKIIQLFVYYQEQLIQKEKENLSYKIFQNLSIEKIMKEFILNVEDIILINHHHKSFLTPWLKETLKNFLLNQDDDDENVKLDEVKLLSYSILTNFFKQISERHAQDRTRSIIEI